jgi:hypothetical protein
MLVRKAQLHRKRCEGIILALDVVFHDPALGILDMFVPEDSWGTIFVGRYTVACHVRSDWAKLRSHKTKPCVWSTEVRWSNARNRLHGSTTLSRIPLDDFGMPIQDRIITTSALASSCGTECVVATALVLTLQVTTIRQCMLIGTSRHQCRYLLKPH